MEPKFTASCIYALDCSVVAFHWQVWWKAHSSGDCTGAIKPSHHTVIRPGGFPSKLSHLIPHLNPHREVGQESVPMQLWGSSPRLGQSTEVAQSLRVCWEG